jgi:membrane associated rhomboid family serine protease
MAIRVPGTMPWSFLTYPFIGSGNGGELLFFLLLLFWLYMMGTGLEAQVGTRGLLGLFFGGAFLAGITYWLVSLALSSPGILTGAGLAVSMLTMYWAGKNRQAQASFFGVIPMPAPVLAGLIALLIVFGYGTGSPLRGLALLVPLGIFFALGSDLIRLPSTASLSDKKEKKRKDEEFRDYMDKVKDREKEREERERLRKLFESSSKDDEPK